jgi:hypothetical protein
MYNDINILAAKWESAPDHQVHLFYPHKIRPKYLKIIRVFGYSVNVILRHPTSRKINKLRGVVMPVTGEQPGRNSRWKPPVGYSFRIPNSVQISSRGVA